eukprot:1854545-Rhodomonas_salina.1
MSCLINRAGHCTFEGKVGEKPYAYHMTMAGKKLITTSVMNPSGRNHSTFVNAHVRKKHIKTVGTRALGFVSHSITRWSGIPGSKNEIKSSSSTANRDVNALI